MTGGEEPRMHVNAASRVESRRKGKVGGRRLDFGATRRDACPWVGEVRMQGAAGLWFLPRWTNTGTSLDAGRWMLVAGCWHAAGTESRGSISPSRSLGTGLPPANPYTYSARRRQGPSLDGAEQSRAGRAAGAWQAGTVIRRCRRRAGLGHGQWKWTSMDAVDTCG